MADAFRRRRGRDPSIEDLRRLAHEAGLGTGESEPVIDQVVESCRRFAID